ncbi:phage fiber-tail adaptor protein [Falsirhodobacter sp. 20TX0035]|uniref:phage fiber-tail adaptor protein n=1 Tax=Falsirhodobacter sp. 20TX0035 TaxID=3022019 RepID=UPI00232B00C9|nr:hypothetical protein [Falsirhodobacter sp. 20TX0035]MDB6454839.1 hypothetical protein [Falsirhodobacter sp. 20TX0035]
MSQARVLLVGPGGAGGAPAGGFSGGGGAGGQVTEALRDLKVGVYPVRVGLGGVSTAPSVSDTSIFGLTAVGGPKGSSGGSGVDGWSGSGGAGSTGANTLGGQAQGGQVGGGGVGSGSNGERHGGGGGGARRPGLDGSAGSTGGEGISSDILGLLRVFGSGGGGGRRAGTSAGGTNAGANGADAVDGFGGGGGGAYGNGSAPGQGGSGRIVIRYRTGTIRATGGTITQVGDDTVHDFTADGTFRVQAIVVQPQGLVLPLRLGRPVLAAVTRLMPVGLRLPVVLGGLPLVTRAQVAAQSLSLRMMLARPRVTLPVRLVTEARTVPAVMATDVSPAWIYHHPAEVLDYAIDWSEWLEALADDRDAVVSATWSVPADLVIGDSGFITPQAVIWIGGGRPHQRYRVDCTLTTQRGRSAVRSLHLYGRGS